VPAPRFHLLRYFGILSSHSRLRREVVPKPLADPTAHGPPPAPGDQLELELGDQGADRTPTRKRWAWLLRHVFAADLDNCRRCSGPMRWVQAARNAEQARELLARLGLGPRPPPSTTRAARAAVRALITPRRRRQSCTPAAAFPAFAAKPPSTHWDASGSGRRTEQAPSFYLASGSSLLGSLVFIDHAVPLA
jgi:hypothetical protein